MGVSRTRCLSISAYAYTDVVYLWFPAGGHAGGFGGVYRVLSGYQTKKQKRRIGQDLSIVALEVEIR
jgi:hypothetical protein